MTNYSLKNSLLTFLLIVLTFNTFAQSNTSSDERLKIRLGFTSAINSHRQLLVTEDANATAGIDFGYDGELFENFQNDMFWKINNLRFVSQGIDVIDANTILPLGLYTGTDGVNTILIDELLNVPVDLGIGIYDSETNTYHEIKDNSGFSINLAAGSYFNRFELRFADLNDDSNNNDDTANSSNNDDLDDDEIPVREDTIDIQYINSTKSIAIQNLGLRAIKSIELYSFEGQLKVQYNNIELDENTTIQTYELKPDFYILVANTELGKITKKISVN